MGKHLMRNRMVTWTQNKFPQFNCKEKNNHLTEEKVQSPCQHRSKSESSIVRQSDIMFLIMHTEGSNITSEIFL